MKWFLNWCSDMHDEYENDLGTLFLVFIFFLVLTGLIIFSIIASGGLVLVVAIIIWGLWQVFKAVISLGATMNRKDEE